jgi:hypothetical protein
VGALASGVFTGAQPWAPEKRQSRFTQWPLWPHQRLVPGPDGYPPPALGGCSTGRGKRDAGRGLLAAGRAAERSPNVAKGPAGGAPALGPATGREEDSRGCLAAGPRGIARDDARRRAHGEPPERRPTTQRSGASALLAITGRRPRAIRTWTATACSRYAMNSARFLGAGICRPAPRAERRRPPSLEMSARSERRSRGLSSRARSAGRSRDGSDSRSCG